MREHPSAPISFGKYLLDAELARGGMSRVFEARLRGPGGFEKQLVVKQILPQLAQDPSFVELLVQEANTLVRMSHPNIVPVYELGIVDGVYFLAMERVHGATVAELLRGAAPLPAPLVAELGAQVAEALRYAHERFGLVHRDVTPRNVMVDTDGHVRLLDFGIAAPSARTGKGELFGSPGYMSPEQAARKALTPASDLFALGALLFEALRGQRAVDDTGAAARLGGDASMPGEPAELAALIDELLASEPEARGSAARTATRLRAFLARVHPEGARERLGQCSEAALERAAARASTRDATTEAGASGAAGAAATSSGTDALRSASEADGATPPLTRSIAASETLTQMLGAGTTEALPKAPRGRAARIAAAGLGTALLAAGALAVALGSDMGTRGERDPEADRAASTPASVHDGPSPIAAPPRASITATAPSVAGSGGATAGVATGTAATTDGSAGSPASPLPTATLTINATPWADARLDGKSLGPTPQRALRVRAGAHVLTLDCPPLGRKARVPLRLAANAHAHVLVDMQAEPPRVSVR